MRSQANLRMAASQRRPVDRYNLLHPYRSPSPLSLPPASMSSQPRGQCSQCDACAAWFVLRWSSALSENVPCSASHSSFSPLSSLTPLRARPLTPSKSCAQAAVTPISRMHHHLWTRRLATTVVAEAGVFAHPAPVSILYVIAFRSYPPHLLRPCTGNPVVGGHYLLSLHRAVALP